MFVHILVMSGDIHAHTAIPLPQKVLQTLSLPASPSSSCTVEKLSELLIYMYKDWLRPLYVLSEEGKMKVEDLLPATRFLQASDTAKPIGVYSFYKYVATELPRILAQRP